MDYQYSKSPLDGDSLEHSIRLSPITVALDYVSGGAGIVIIHFKAALSPDEKIILDNIVATHTGQPLVEPPLPREVIISKDEKTQLGFLKVATYEAEGDSATIISHNFADPCSWFQSSLPIIKETLQVAGENTFAGTRSYWIDLFHGRTYDEDNIVIQNPGKYDVKVYVDNVLQASNLYTVDYPQGRVIFNQTVTGIVTASYYYADKSYYSIRAKPGKVLAIKAAEIQFSAGVILNSPFVFEVWVNIVHPTAGPMTVPVPNTSIYYKNAKDFISACNEGQGVIPAWGELTRDIHVFPFHYARPKPMKYSQGAEIRVYCKNHQPVNAEMATATFYVTIDNEEV